MHAKKRTNKPRLISVRVPTVKNRLDEVIAAVALVRGTAGPIVKDTDRVTGDAIERTLQTAVDHIYFLLKLPEDVLSVKAPDDDQRDAMEQAGGDREIVRMRLETVERAGA